MFLKDEEAVPFTNKLTCFRISLPKLFPGIPSDIFSMDLYLFQIGGNRDNSDKLIYSLSKFNDKCLLVKLNNGVIFLLFVLLASRSENIYLFLRINLYGFKKLENILYYKRLNYVTCLELQLRRKGKSNKLIISASKTRVCNFLETIHINLTRHRFFIFKKRG